MAHLNRDVPQRTTEPVSIEQLAGYSRQERRIVLRDVTARTIECMIAQPCSDPSCHCVIHKWIPKGEVIAYLLSERPSSWNPRNKSHDPVELPLPANGELTCK